MTEQTDEQGRVPFAQIVGAAVVAVVLISVTAVAVGVGIHIVDGRNRDRADAAAAALAAESTVDVTVKEWSVTAKPTAPAGDVTFQVTNDGTMIHELVVLQTDVAAADMPVDNAGDPPAPVATGADKVSEDTNVGETGEPDLPPGETRTFTVTNMEPGHYVLVCNLAGHYANGMYMDFTVVG